MNECPNCGQQAMGWLKKSTLGPARSVQCANCGHKVSVPWWSILIVLPMVAPIFVLEFPASVIGIAVLTAIITPIFVYFVPVVLRN